MLYLWLYFCFFKSFNCIDGEVSPVGLVDYSDEESDDGEDVGLQNDLCIKQVDDFSKSEIVEMESLNDKEPIILNANISGT